MNEQKLPGESSLTTLWIIAITLTLFSFCCAVFSSIPAVIISIVTLRKANKNMRMYHESSNAFAPISYSNVNTAKIISVITLVISSLITLFYLLYFFIYGAFIGAALLSASQSDAWQNDTHSTEDDATWSQEVVDDWVEEVEEIESDTLLIESIELDSIY